MSTPVAVPVKGKPGTIFIPAINREVTQIDSREDDVYDSIGIASGSVAAGSNFPFFDSTTGKVNTQYANIPRAHRIPSGYELSLLRIGLYLRTSSGNAGAVGVADIKRIYENGYVLARIGKREIAEGPAVKFQSGYGLAGQTSETNANVIALGSPSAVAAPELKVPQDVTDDDDIFTDLKFPDAAQFLTSAYWGTVWATFSLDLRLVVTCFWHGVIRKPLGK